MHIMKERRNKVTNQNTMTIRQQISMFFIIDMLLVLFVCWFVNTVSLEKFYVWNKQKSMMYAYDSFNRAAKKDILDSEEYVVEWQRICYRYSISAVVLDMDSKALICSSNDVGNMEHRLMDYFFLPEKDEEINPESILVDTQKYKVQIIKDSRMESEYLEMWGVLDNGNPFLIRSSLEGIRDSVQISSQFLLYVGIIAVLVGSLIIRYVSRRISRPILDLANISKKMTHLDFEARYEEKEGETTEIRLLGENINTMSQALKRTISELKTANNELQRDINNKNKIDEMRKEFLSNVSHELKTPIALIQGYAEGLQEGISDDPESMHYYCDVIMDEASKMNQMVKKLMTLNELEFGNDAVKMERFDIIAMIRNYLQSAEILLVNHCARVIMEEYEPVYVWADEFKIEEVFNNFFSNALNHLEGDRIIRIRATILQEVVRLSVFNTGKPIPQECLAHLWDKFYKVDKARTRSYGGSGVGLSIVKAIMESMHQKYGVVNYADGVEFWVELEVAKTKE